jgi:hypothetical protein
MTKCQSRPVIGEQGHLFRSWGKAYVVHIEKSLIVCSSSRVGVGCGRKERGRGGVDRHICSSSFPLDLVNDTQSSPN